MNTLATTKPSIEVNSASFEWQLEQGSLHFFGLPSVLFWLNPSLLRMLQPLAEEVGFPLFRLLVAYHSSLGTDEDYRTMVTILGNTFEEGFLAWGNAVSSAGWGTFELPTYDPITECATVIVRNPWEMGMQHGQAHTWGCPFMLGKIIGIFTHAFGTTCWADEQIDSDSPVPSVTFSIYPSALTLTEELSHLREQRRQDEQHLLTQEIAHKALELRAVQEEQVRMQEEALRAQAAIIAELSTPLIPINDQVVLMPLIGQLDSQRAQRVLDTLLNGVAAHDASIAILDITGLPIVDTSVANILIQAAQAVRLLGTDVVITGIRPEVAQTLVGLGVDLKDIITRGTLQSGVTYAIERSRHRKT